MKKDKEKGGAWYPACPNAGEPCRNLYKVTQTTDGQWFCDKCQGTFPNCCLRWIFSGTIKDDTATTWVSFYNSQAETLLGGETTADDAFEKWMKNGRDYDGYESLFFKAQFTEWIFRCKVQTQEINGERTVRSNVINLHPVDYIKDSYDMLEQLHKWSM